MPRTNVSHIQRGFSSNQSRKDNILILRVLTAEFFLALARQARKALTVVRSFESHCAGLVFLLDLGQRA